MFVYLYTMDLPCCYECPRPWTRHWIAVEIRKTLTLLQLLTIKADRSTRPYLSVSRHNESAASFSCAAVFVSIGMPPMRSSQMLAPIFSPTSTGQPACIAPPWNVPAHITCGQAHP